MVPLEVQSAPFHSINLFPHLECIVVLTCNDALAILKTQQQSVHVVCECFYALVF